MAGTKRGPRAARAAAVVPLAVVSAAWTAHLAGTGPTPVLGVAASPSVPGETPPAVVELPEAVPEAPASLTPAREVPAALPQGRLDATDGSFSTIADQPSAREIPSVALAAYQRAETVINAADVGCRLPWQLLAAVGRVESDHGRFGGSALDDDGVAAPAIVGIALDGRNGTALIRDTDAGELDGDSRFDRAVGPMQFIPSTWAVVGVDADDDGVRDPQDVDDAALAAAVYLCSGDDDLTTLAGQRDAVFRYNHSEAYVDLVLSLMESYLDSDFTLGGSTTTAAGVVSSGVTPVEALPPAELPVESLDLALVLPGRETRGLDLALAPVSVAPDAGGGVPGRGKRFEPAVDLAFEQPARPGRPGRPDTDESVDVAEPDAAPGAGSDGAGSDGAGSDGAGSPRRVGARVASPFSPRSRPRSPPTSPPSRSRDRPSRRRPPPRSRPPSRVANPAPRSKPPIGPASSLPWPTGPRPER